MIRIYRPSKVPQFLLSDVVKQARQRLNEYLRRPVHERQQRRAPIAQELFFDNSLYEELFSVFKGKCAFCETAYLASGSRKASHFRPLREGSDDGRPDGKDYYAWLALEWRNLFLMCAACERAKGHRFPVARARASYMASFDSIRNSEENLLIDPTLEDPGRHFNFLMDGFCEASTARGQVTREIFDLNREQLVSERKEALEGVINVWPRCVDGDARLMEATFDIGAHHSGARLDALKRALSSWPIASQLDSTSRRSLPRSFASALLKMSNQERERFGHLFDELKVADEERRRRLEQEGEQEFSPRTSFERPISMALRPIMSRELESVTIRGMKAIEAIELKLPTKRSSSSVPCIMLLGENSVGKSTTLCAIALALIGTREAKRLKLDFSEYVRSVRPDEWDQLDSPTIDVRVKFHDLDQEASFLFSPIEGAVEGSPSPSTVVLGYGPRRYFHPRRVERREGGHRRVRTLFDPLAVIPYPVDWLQSLPIDTFSVVARALREVLSLSDTDELTNDERNGICVRASGQITPIDRLSEGYRSLFAMTVDIVREMLDYWPNLEDAQGVVLIDEIETHLHPRWKMRVMGSLRRAFPQVQFIATTHDPLCLRGMDDGEVFVLQRDEDNKVQILDDLPSIKGMRAEQLLTSDYFGLSSTFDPDMEIDVARFADEASRRSLDFGAVEGGLDHSGELINRLVLGDTAKEQIIQAALERYLSERRRPEGGLRVDVKEEAVEAVLAALRTPNVDSPEKS